MNDYKIFNQSFSKIQFYTYGMYSLLFLDHLHACYA